MDAMQLLVTDMTLPCHLIAIIITLTMAELDGSFVTVDGWYDIIAPYMTNMAQYNISWCLSIIMTFDDPLLTFAGAYVIFVLYMKNARKNDISWVSDIEMAFGQPLATTTIFAIYD